ncbi:uncharacterized protein LOC131328555 [Rhododendron vialii]|uniref:uncharacterized protein LOC131328555 n=1 Tax=Rhododendron vialii TaxID=182163 RepID=UPI00265D7CCF|nr:uncharacterized protein LOC131328555 [Rhododendron vialii]
MFSVKSAYLQRFEEAFGGVLRREQAHFKVKDALIMKNIQVGPSCPVCGEALETIEHLFFECDFVRKVWRASYLGFDFSKRNLFQFGDWFSMWLREATNKEVVRDSIFMMWAIWCARNDALFNSNKPNVDCVLRCFSGISSLYRSTLVKMKSETCFLFDESSMDIEVGVVSSFVVDGAWLAATGVGAAAWVQEGSCREAKGQVMQCMASSATVMEIKAGLILMEWAIKEKLRGIYIKTDCLTLVQGLKDPNSVAKASMPQSGFEASCPQMFLTV